MVEVLMRVHPSGTALVPATDQEAEQIEALRSLGGVLKVKVTQDRTNRFHRKAMALFRYLFQLWEPADMADHGVPVQKDFESFRKNLTIRAGFYRQVFDLKGGFVLEAESLNWRSMDNTRFNEVYGRIIDVALDMLGYQQALTPEQVDIAVERVLSFA